MFLFCYWSSLEKEMKRKWGKHAYVHVDFFWRKETMCNFEKVILPNFSIYIYLVNSFMGLQIILFLCKSNSFIIENMFHTF